MRSSKPEICRKIAYPTDRVQYATVIFEKKEGITLAQKADVMEFEGKILETLPNATFRVKLPNDMIIIAHVSGKIRQRYIKIIPGDRVLVEVSVYDPTKGRITWRL